MSELAASLVWEVVDRSTGRPNRWVSGGFQASGGASS